MWYIYVGVKHIGGIMLERIPKGDAILIKVSFDLNILMKVGFDLNIFDLNILLAYKCSLIF